jgi:hypothetical protein
MASFDQGNVLPLATGTAITNAYNANTTSGALYGAAASQVNAYLVLTTVNASPITTVTVKFEASYDGVQWNDVLSKSEDTGTEAIEHAFTLGAAPQTKNVMVICRDQRGSIGGVRVRAKADASGIAGDSIVANVTFS